MTKINLFLCIVILLLSACRSDEKSTQASQQETPAIQSDAGPGPDITTIGFSRKDTVLHYALDIKYPAIREHEVFNTAVRHNLETAIDDFIGFIKDFEGEGRAMNSAYQLIRNTSRVTSIRQQYEWAVPGTSTLQYRFYNVNYNSEARALISLAGLFKEGVGYGPFLKAKLAEKIKSRFNIEVGVTEEDLQTFVVGPDHLEFYKVLYPEVMDPEPKAFQVKFSEMGDKLR
ncbi:MAG: hypothetical protein H6557_01270 [Lewinellaceae bacterium]|nr:hypothetical protein [Phaeodactylibacter sp.]MCB9035232.1 hypothetical protein [Lewinellaceae bacterium]